MTALLDVLIPTFGRPAALAVTLTSLIPQTWKDFRVVISDQNDNFDVEEVGEVKAVLSVLRAHGHPVEVYNHLPRRGLAEQRQFLLRQVKAAYSLFIDDDLILEPYVLDLMLMVLREEGCGFVGCAVHGLSYIDDVRPQEQHVEFWQDRVRPEQVQPESEAWNRHRLHNAANLYHVQQRSGATPERPIKYKIAWVGGCVMYDSAKLRSAGGFDFWTQLPSRHSGEDVLAQLRVMARYGGCGIMPSGVYHLELPTTIPEREIDAPKVLVQDRNKTTRANAAYNGKPGASSFWVSAGAENHLRGAGGLIPDVKKIAVLRSNGLGDFIFTLPALEALRAAYPQAEIVLLGLEWHAQFLDKRPGPIDRVEIVPKSPGVRNDSQEEDPAELSRFFEKMEHERFDLAVQMHGGGRYSNPFVQRLRARVTAGSCTEDAVPLDRWLPYSYYHLEVLRFLEVVSLVGAVPTVLEPRILLTEPDLAEAAGVVSLEEQALVVLHPGAGDPRRRWSAEKFASIGNALAWAGSRVVVIGMESERDLVERVVGSMSAEAVNLCGRLSVSGLAGLLSRTGLVISNDSGPLHLARAVGAPTVGIYWCGNMINAGPVTHARHHTAISWRLDCPVCGMDCTRGGCDHKVSFVDDVSEVEVNTAALELMDLYGSSINQHLLAHP